MQNNELFNTTCLVTLQKSPLFAGLQEQVIDKMLQGFTRRVWARGTHLFPEQYELCFHIIISGRIEVSRCHPDTGRSITICLFGPGDGFDIITLLDGKIHDVILVMLDKVETMAAPMDKVRQWLVEHPDFNRRFFPYLGKQMRYLEDLSTDLALHNTITRLARLILHFVDQEHNFPVSRSYPVHLINDFSHDALASMIGTVRTVINRHLHQLKKEGVIEFHRGYIAVKNLEKLALHAGQTLHKLKKTNKIQHNSYR